MLIIFGALLAHLIGGLLLTVGFALFGFWIAFSVFTLYFFRRPRPISNPELGLVYAPASGMVDVIELAERSDLPGKWRCISIFMSIFDVHIQCAPCAGTVIETIYREGQFLNALRRQSAECNEQMWICLEPIQAKGTRLWIRLIAGLIARRIECWVRAGDRLDFGEELGMIRFGSRVELWIPPEWDLLVRPRTRVHAGRTPLARIKKVDL